MMAMSISFLQRARLSRRSVHRAPGTPVPGRVDRDCSMSVRRDRRRSGGVSFELSGGGGK